MRTRWSLHNTPGRPSRSSAYCGRFAELKSLTLRRTLGRAKAALPLKLSSGQRLRTNLAVCFGGVSVHILAFEFVGLAILALCLIVLAIPADRRPSGRHVGD